MRKRPVVTAFILALAVIMAGVLIISRSSDLQVPYETLNDAVRTRDKNAVLRLISNGTDPNELSKEGLHPLYVALSVDDVEIVGILLSAGADTEATLPDDFVEQLVKSAREGSEESLAWIRQHGVSTVDEFLARREISELHSASHATTPLITASGNGQLEFVRLFLEHGAKTEARATGGFTPMHMAAIQGHPAVIRTLIERGARIDSLNDNNETPLTVASAWGRLEVVQTLLEAGANPTLSGESGFTAVESAALNGQTAVLRALSARGVDINTRGLGGATPIYMASMNGHTDSVRFLLEPGADPNAPTDSGLTPLHRAASDGRDDVVKALLDGGANPVLTTPDGNSAASFASNNGHDSLAGFLDGFDGAPVD